MFHFGSVTVFFFAVFVSGFVGVVFCFSSINKRIVPPSMSSIVEELNALEANTFSNNHVTWVDRLG